MRTNFAIVSIAALLSIPAPAQGARPSASDKAASVTFAEKTAIAALNFQQGDLGGFTRAREDFTADGWKRFVHHMDGFLDEKGAPTFTSSFVAEGSATILDEKEGVLHLRIPGTLTQSSKLGRTTYRAALEVYVAADASGSGKPFKIQRLEQTTCGGSSKAC